MGNAPLLPGLLGLHGVDLVHLHMPFYFGAELATLAARARRIPLVVTYHQDVILPRRVGRWLANWHDRWVGAWCLRSAERVCFTTLDYGRASRIRWLFTERPSHVAEIPNGVDLRRFHPSAPGDGVRQEHGLRAETIVLLLVASLDRAHYFKGVGVLLKALAQLGSPDAHLLIVGDGDLRASYQALAAELGL